MISWIGSLGSVLAGMFGYQDAPTVSTLGAYLIYLVLALATALERAGRTDEAIGEVEMLLREHPARPGARALLERLRQPSPP